MNPDPESIDLEAHPELEPEFAPEPDDQGARHAACSLAAASRVPMPVPTSRRRAGGGK